MFLVSLQGVLLSGDAEKLGNLLKSSTALAFLGLCCLFFSMDSCAASLLEGLLLLSTVAPILPRTSAEALVRGIHSSSSLVSLSMCCLLQPCLFPPSLCCVAFNVTFPLLSTATATTIADVPKYPLEEGAFPVQDVFKTLAESKGIQVMRFRSLL